MTANTFSVDRLEISTDCPHRARFACSGMDAWAYCRGPCGVLSYEAVAILRARGFKVRRLEDGLPEWRGAGLPVEGGGATPAPLATRTS
jgi:hypothetical protein